ncbi:MAG: zinc ribbon domain-containing protein [Chloroflexota bacterium]|nr:zinc ribbon domain-containing protein [Chloroflexota bacterium]
MKFACKYCEQINPDTADYCSACGRHIKGPSDIPERNLKVLVIHAIMVYKRGFFQFIAIALLAEIPNLLGYAFADNLRNYIFVLSLPLYFLSTSAGIYGTALVVSGHRLDVGICYSKALNKFPHIFLAYLMMILACIGASVLALILIGIPILAYLLVIWFFVLQVLMFEGATAIGSLERSRSIVDGNWWRVFGRMIVLVGVPGAVYFSALLIIQSLTSELATIVVSSILALLVTPFTLIGPTLAYIDMRVRKEGYDLSTLNSEIGYLPKD